MKLIEFPEQTHVIAKNQPQYNPMPAWIEEYDSQGGEGRIICCWQLTIKERIKLLFSGKLWHHILTFQNPVQPQLLQLDSPFIKTKHKGTTINEN